MNNIVNEIKKYVIDKSNSYKEKNKYDFWTEHINYVDDNAIMLAKEYNADLEIVELAALLHDISLINEIGPREEHHTYSSQVAKEILGQYGYPKEKTGKVLNCILNHRDRNKYPRTSMEEDCVGDADIISHFDNIPMIFSKAYLILKLSHSAGAKYVRDSLNNDYEGLSPKTKEIYKDKFENIIKILFRE